jgi:hypothetical protein
MSLLFREMRRIGKRRFHRILAKPIPLIAAIRSPQQPRFARRDARRRPALRPLLTGEFDQDSALLIRLYFGPYLVDADRTETRLD